MRSLLFFIFLIFCLNLFAQPVKPNNDSIQIRNTINGFYNWYNKNYQKLDAFKLYSDFKIKQGPPFRINWKEVERYFAFIRRNAPQLGEEFINNQRLFFRQCDSAFKTQLEDEIPYGFDYDWYTNSQEEPQWLLDEFKKAKQWAIAIHGARATVDVLGSYEDNGKEIETVVLCAEMKKEKGKWKIAKIGCTFAATGLPASRQANEY